MFTMVNLRYLRKNYLSVGWYILIHFTLDSQKNKEYVKVLKHLTKVDPIYHLPSWCRRLQPIHNCFQWNSRTEHARTFLAMPRAGRGNFHMQ